MVCIYYHDFYQAFAQSTKPYQSGLITTIFKTYLKKNFNAQKKKLFFKKYFKERMKQTSAHLLLQYVRNIIHC